MSATDKIKLDGAVAAPTANALALRDSAGRAQFAYPAVLADVASADYVEDRIATRASSSHSHDTSSITSGTMSTARLPYASGSSNGIMTSSNYNLLNSATWEQYANSIVYRGADSTFYVASPGKNFNPATKGYVDSTASRREWKTNVRAFPYGLEEVSRLGALTRLYDYTQDEPTPVHMRGRTDEMGVFVEDLHQIMPLLTTLSEDDGDPENVKDRALLWPVIRSIHELERGLSRVLDHLGLTPLAEGE